LCCRRCLRALCRGEEAAPCLCVWASSCCPWRTRSHPAPVCATLAPVWRPVRQARASGAVHVGWLPWTAGPSSVATAPVVRACTAAPVAVVRVCGSRSGETSIGVVDALGGVTVLTPVPADRGCRGVAAFALDGRPPADTVVGVAQAGPGVSLRYGGGREEDPIPHGWSLCGAVVVSRGGVGWVVDSTPPAPPAPAARCERLDLAGPVTRAAAAPSDPTPLFVYGLQKPGGALLCVPVAAPVPAQAGGSRGVHPLPALRAQVAALRVVGESAAGAKAAHQALDAVLAAANTFHLLCVACGGRGGVVGAAGIPCRTTPAEVPLRCSVAPCVPTPPLVAPYGPGPSTASAPRFRLRLEVPPALQMGGPAWWVRNARCSHAACARAGAAARWHLLPPPPPPVFPSSSACPRHASVACFFFFGPTHPLMAQVGAPFVSTVGVLCSGAGLACGRGPALASAPWGPWRGSRGCWRPGRRPWPQPPCRPFVGCVAVCA
jgi:hypothetical protein